MITLTVLAVMDRPRDSICHLSHIAATIGRPPNPGRPPSPLHHSSQGGARCHAYVLVARCLNAEEQWRAFRYAMIHNWNVHPNEKFDALVDIPGSVLRNLEMIETTARRVRF